jgi:hypothetical protein
MESILSSNWLLVLLTLVWTIAVAVIVFVEVLWNMTVPAIFGLRPITFWQAFRLLLLSGLLLGHGCVSFNLNG